MTATVGAMRDYFDDLFRMLELDNVKDPAAVASVVAERTEGMPGEQAAAVREKSYRETLSVSLRVTNFLIGHIARESGRTPDDVVEWLRLEIDAAPRPWAEEPPNN